MGKQTGKKKLKSVVLKVKQQQQQNKALDQGSSPKSSSYDKDTAVFVSMSHEHKEEGNRLFQKKDYEGAILKYEKAINLLPRNHIDVSSLHSNIAACYMHMGLSDYPRAIQECNKALEVTPKYSKALLKRARCYEALNRLDLALRDVHIVLNLEPKNLTATEIEQRIKMVVEERGGTMNDIDVNSIPVPEYVDITPCACSFVHRLKEKAVKKKKGKDEKKIEQEVEDNVEEKENDEQVEEENKKSNEVKKKVELKSEDRVEETNGYEEVEAEEVNTNAVEMKLNQHSEYNAEENESSVHVEEEKFAQENEGRVEEYENDYYFEELKKKSSNVVQKSKDSVDEEDGNEYLEVEKKKRNKVHEKKKSEDGINEDEYYERVKEKRSRRRNEEKNNDEQVEEKRKSNKVGKKFKQKLEDRIEGKKKKVEVEEKKKISKVGKKFKQKIEDRIEGKKNDVQREDIANVKIEKSCEEKCEEKKAEDKLVVEEKKSTNSVEDEPKMNVKLVFGEDIRWAKIPVNCNVLKLREVIFHRYPSAKAFLVKYRDQEGDMVTITTNEELRWAEANVEPLGSFKLYIVEVTPEQDPFLGQVKSKGHREKKVDVNGQICIDDWLIQFAQLFKNYVGFSSDAYLDLHELGMKLYSEAMEDTVTSEEAQDLFNAAADKFHEMSALALFNCGNVHMSTARKKVYFTEDDYSRGSILEQVKVSYDWAQEEYFKAGERYQQALIIKPDFYEGYLALGKQQFEMAKLSWYFAVGSNVDLETWNSTEVFQLYNSAEDNMEKGMQMWEEAEKQRKKEALRPSKVKLLLQKMDLDKAIKDITAAEAAEQARNMRSQINLLWGSMLYERSIMEYKLGIPVWHECLEVSVEKFEVAGASPTDIAVMIKNHCSNDNALEGLGFNIDEIVEAWNEMYDAKRWQRGVPSFRLEPLLRRRVSKLYHALERA